MEREIIEFYKQPNIGKYENVHLQTLSECCVVLEERVYALARALPEEDRSVIVDYINARNDLEVEMFKTALRWGKEHYK